MGEAGRGALTLTLAGREPLLVELTDDLTVARLRETYEIAPWNLLVGAEGVVDAGASFRWRRWSFWAQTKDFSKDENNMKIRCLIGWFDV